MVFTLNHFKLLKLIRAFFAFFYWYFFHILLYHYTVVPYRLQFHDKGSRLRLSYGIKKWLCI